MVLLGAQRAQHPSCTDPRILIRYPRLIDREVPGTMGKGSGMGKGKGKGDDGGVGCAFACWIWLVGQMSRRHQLAPPASDSQPFLTHNSWLLHHRDLII